MRARQRVGGVLQGAGVDAAENGVGVEVEEKETVAVLSDASGAGAAVKRQVRLAGGLVQVRVMVSVKSPELKRVVSFRRGCVTPSARRC